MKDGRKLFTHEFVSLNLILAAAFCNVSVFYSFYHYLGHIDIPVAWRGFLLGLEPMSAFFLRLFVIPWIHVRNAFSFMTAALLGMILVSWLYLWAVTVPALVFLRILHGGVFVLLTASVIALIVHFIPKEKSGQGFGTVTLSTMIPYAIIPPAMETLLPYVRTEADLFAGVSLLNVAALALLWRLRKGIDAVVEAGDASLAKRPNMGEIRENFRQRPVVLILTAGLFVYFAHATVFYFIKDLSIQIGLSDVGAFFSISMLTIILTRAAGGSLFDRLNKKYLLIVGLALICGCMAVLPYADGRILFYFLAGLYGLAVGVTLPMLNALLFSASVPALRGLNTNMTFFTLDAGYFIMPYVGGLLIAFGTGFDALFYCGAAFIFAAILLIAGLKGEREVAV